MTSRFYCKKCDCDFETRWDEYSANCPYCSKVITNPKPKVHSDYEKCWCDGVLTFEGGNQYGCTYRCGGCWRFVVLQTKAQIKERGIIKI